MKKSTANHMHRKRRKNNLTWLFALLGILVLFLGTILAFLIFSNLSSKPAETVQEVSAVNVEKDIPETDMGDLIYHEPAAENVVMPVSYTHLDVYKRQSQSSTVSLRCGNAAWCFLT